MKYIENGVVYESVVYSNRLSVKCCRGSINKIEIITENISININENITITVSYKVFDPQKEDWVVDNLISKTVDVNINDIIQPLDIVEGIGTFQFESAEPGIYVIKIEDATCEVVVQ